MFIPREENFNPFILQRKYSSSSLRPQWKSWTFLVPRLFISYSSYEKKHIIAHPEFKKPKDPFEISIQKNFRKQFDSEKNDIKIFQEMILGSPLLESCQCYVYLEDSPAIFISRSIIVSLKVIIVIIVCWAHNVLNSWKWINVSFSQRMMDYKVDFHDFHFEVPDEVQQRICLLTRDGEPMIKSSYLCVLHCLGRVQCLTQIEKQRTILIGLSISLGEVLRFDVTCNTSDKFYQ